LGSPADTIPLFETIDGGKTWTAVDSINGPKPAGLCGIWIVDSPHIYAAGRFQGPAYFLSSSDGGHSWMSTDMSSFAVGLIDCYFFTPDSGIVIGFTDEPGNMRAIVLFIPDGGITWDRRHISNTSPVLAWKISFPDADTGFVSIQGSTDSVHYLKSTDRGRNWQEIGFRAGNDFTAQGIGFATTSYGWIGPHPQLGQIRNIYETRDGGDSWQLVNFGRNINRFRMLSDTLGYAIGETVYKYTRDILNPIQDFSTDQLIHQYSLYQNYPNPFNPTTIIGYRLATVSDVELSIYNLLGQKIEIIVNKNQPAAEYKVEWDARGFASGIYFYRLHTQNFTEIKKMVLMR
jgi:hypothetical protein